MILVIGEALIDLIENRYQAGSFNAVVGGANANVALALARRGTCLLYTSDAADE
jgi:fructokinase